MDSFSLAKIIISASRMHIMVRLPVACCAGLLDWPQLLQAATSAIRRIASLPVPHTGHEEALQRLEHLVACLQAVAFLRKTALADPGQPMSQPPKWTSLPHTSVPHGMITLVCEALSTAGPLMQACCTCIRHLGGQQLEAGRKLLSRHSCAAAKAMLAAVQLQEQPAEGGEVGCPVTAEAFACFWEAEGCVAQEGAAMLGSHRH